MLLRSFVILRSFVMRHPIACFFLLAYVLTWGAIPWDSLFTPGALIAAVAVVLVKDGPCGLLHLSRRVIRWRVSRVMLRPRFWTAIPPIEGSTESSPSSRATAAVSAGPRDQPVFRRPLGRSRQ